jgi:transcriptional regulator with XRE-family HTH domain
MPLDDSTRTRYYQIQEECVQLRNLFSRFLDFCIQQAERQKGVVAELGGLSKSAISKYVKGERMPGPEVVVRLASALAMRQHEYKLLSTAYYISVDAEKWLDTLKPYAPDCVPPAEAAAEIQMVLTDIEERIAAVKSKLPPLDQGKISKRPSGE